MLNRRILRIKVFKTLYSRSENQDMTLKEAQKLFSASCEATRDLYLFMLSVTSALAGEALSRLDAAAHKFHPTEEEKNPNMKFAHNGISSLLSQDPDFTKILSKKKLSWDQYDAFLRKLYDSVREKEYYQKYMSSGETSLKEDAALWKHIFEEEFEDSEDLHQILEDESILWVDDLSYALIQCCKTMDTLGEGRVWEMPELVSSDNSSFAENILDTGFACFGEFRQWIAESASKWKDDRLFNVDVALIVLGLAEYKKYPQTPKGIIINECVEISKYYSTPKSSAFVNGMLDELMKSKLSI